jgi:hypothetical protein
MSRVFRHDAITLRESVRPEDFTKFMTDELVPYFSTRFKGPTRSSRADIKHQTVLEDGVNRHRYLWVTVWDGSPESVGGSSFERARMSEFVETTAILKKLESFGVRAAEKIFIDLVDIEVGTNH